MSTADAARYLGCSISALNYRGLSGYLGKIAIENGCKRYSRSALDAFILKYGRSNAKRRTVSDKEKKVAQEAAEYFVRRAKDILGKASKELDEELRQTFESYPHDAVRLAKLIRSHIRFSHRAPFAGSGFVSTFLCCDFAKLIRR